MTDEQSAIRTIKMLVKKLGGVAELTEEDFRHVEGWELMSTERIAGGLTLRLVPPPITVTKQ